MPVEGRYKIAALANRAERPQGAVETVGDDRARVAFFALKSRVVACSTAKALPLC